MRQMSNDRKSTITRQLMELQHMGVLALQAKFEELFGFPTNQSKVQTLRKRLAFRIQELYFGGLSTSEIKKLDDIADKDPQANLEKTSKGEIPMLPGSRLTRIWKGKEHEVTITRDGRFEYNGRFYRSLSGIACEITGAHWNGKVFFGIK